MVLANYSVVNFIEKNPTKSGNRLGKSNGIANFLPWDPKMRVQGTKPARPPLPMMDLSACACVSPMH